MTRPPCPRPLQRFVYVIGPEQGWQKVGIATDPHARLAALRTASPFELVVHAAIPVPFRAAHQVERQAHTLLAHCRARNEWFETTPANAVAAVTDAATPFAGKATSAPDPAAVWPAVSSWRVGRASPSAEGLPLFDYHQTQSPPAEAETKRGVWSLLRRPFGS